MLSIIPEKVGEQAVETSIIREDAPRPYHIIAGCLSSEENAQNLVDSLKTMRYQESENIGKMNGLYTVSIGAIISKEEAIERMELAKSDFTNGLWLYRIPKP